MKTQFGLEVRDNMQDKTGGIKLPGTFEERQKVMIGALCGIDFDYHVCGMNPQGLLIFLVGDKQWSRAMAMHPEDAPGIFYLIKDNGDEIDITKPVTLESALWLGELIDYDNLRYHCITQEHRNSRLKF